MKVLEKIGGFFCLLIVAGCVVCALTLCASAVEPIPQDAPEVYDVVSVYTYSEIDTTIWGDVVSQDIVYYITYMKNGKLEQKGGITNIALGEDNEYHCFINNNNVLYLTQETLQNIQLH